MNRMNNTTSILLFGALIFLLATVASIGCGELADGETSFDSDCSVGLGECLNSEICVDGNCDSIEDHRFPMTIEKGDFPWERNFQVEVRHRGDDLILETEKSNSTTMPFWFETTDLVPYEHTDWWEVKVISHGIVLSNTVLTCGIEFDAADFEIERELVCENDDGYINILIEPAH